MPANSPILAIIIVTYNSRHEIGACLESIVAHTEPHPTQVVVVDNQSSDGTPDFVRTHWPQVRTLDAGGNLGFARANNLGAAASQGEFVLLLNPDTVALPGAVATLIRELAARPDAAIAGPRLLDEGNVPELSFGPPISPWGELQQKTLLALHRRRVRGVTAYIDRVSRQAGERAWVSGACLLIRRQDWDAAGGLDERYFMYTEDVDLCTTMRGRGRKVLFVPQAEVRHLRGRSAGRNPETERMRRLSHLAFYEKHLPRWVGPLRLYLRLTGKLAHA